MQRDDRDAIQFVAVLVLTTGILFYAGFFFGRKYEKKFWIKAIPEALEKTCLECAGITR